MDYKTGIPIPASKTCERIEENGKAAGIRLSPEVVKEIRQVVEGAEEAGERYPDQFMAQVGLDSLPLHHWTGKRV